MNILSTVSVALIGVFLIILLREVNSGYILPVSIALGSFLLLGIYPFINDILTYSEEMMESSVSSDNIKLLYKAIGTAFIIQYISGLSRECGVESIASKIEIAGKIYIISLCIPLVQNLLYAVNNF